MDINSGKEPTPGIPAGMSGKKVSILAFFALLAISLFTYYIVPLFVIPFFTVKPAQTRAVLGTIATALQSYRTDHGAFPPEDDLTHYRSMTKNLAKSHAVGISTYRAANLTTPVAYLDVSKISDPYALPDQYAPPAYIRGFFKDGSGEFALIFSPGPNLLYEFRPPNFHDVASPAALAVMLAKKQFDPTNGTRSRGDFYWALIAHGDSTFDSIAGVPVQ